MSAVLPADLFEAEERTLVALQEALASKRRGRWQITWKFEGLRLLGPALRLATALKESGRSLLLAWPDAGAAALAKRDGPELAECCVDLMQLQRDPAWAQRGDLLLIVGAQPSDYDTVEAVCNQWMEPVVLLNGRLEDAAVGIGSVARTRRRGFCVHLAVGLSSGAFCPGSTHAGALERMGVVSARPRWLSLGPAV